MKQFFCAIGLCTLLISCGNEDAKEKLAIDAANASISVVQVVGIGKIAPEHEIIQLSSAVNGIVEKILKKENDSVSMGTPILELNHQLEDAKVNQLSSEIETQKDQVRANEASTGEYEARYKNTLSEVQRLQRLLAEGAETQQAVDDANTNLKAFESNLKKLQADVAVAKSKLTQSKAALAVAMVERDQKIIKSPVTGKLLELSTLVGSSVDTRESFAQIRPEGQTIAECEIDELYADKIVVGQQALVRNVGSLDTLSTGTIYFASSFLKKKSLFTDQAGEKEDRRVRTIKVMLDHADHLLLNARVECVIDISGSRKK